MSPPKLSIVVPSMNQARFLGEALDSLACQQGLTSGDLEILVIDGGSTDGSVDIIRAYSGILAYSTSEPDLGQTHALRKGFLRAKAAIFGWLCADDVLEPWTARQVIDLFASRPEVEFAYGDVTWIDVFSKKIRTKKEIPFCWFIWLNDHNYIPQPAAFFRRGLYERVGGLDQQFTLAMDADLWARFAQQTRPVHVRSLWARVRIYPEQRTQRYRVQRIAEDDLIRRRLGVPHRGRPSKLLFYVCAKALRVAWKLASGCYW